MTVTVYSADEYPQGSDAWREFRAGIPTASNFHRALAGGDGKVRTDYLYKLAGEIMTQRPMTEFRSAAMDRGNEMEGGLLDLFAMIEDVEPERVSFVRREEKFGVIGASPDAFIGDDCGVEIKSAEPHVLIDILKKDRVPPEHIPQIQGNMLVTGRRSWWIAIGSYPGMPMFRRMIKRDESAMARLRLGLETFYEDLNQTVSFIKNYGKKRESII